MCRLKREAQVLRPLFQAQLVPTSFGGGALLLGRDLGGNLKSDPTIAKLLHVNSPCWISRQT